jgi:DNA-damage-inducible protein J
MNLTDQINIRIENSLRKEAEEVLGKLGMKTGDAIRMFLRQVCLTQSLPLNVKVPNKTTKQAIEELEKGEGIKMNLDKFHKMLDKI